MRRRLPELLLAVAAMGLLLGLIEWIFAAVDYDYRPLTIAARDDLRDRFAFSDDHFEFDSRLLWRPRAGYEIFNTQGYRGPLLAEAKPSGETRIFTIGDSNTLGWRGDDGAHWPGRMAGLAGPGVRVVNAGVWGYASLQGLARLEDALRYEPDIVTISFGSNDAHRVRVGDADRVGRGVGASWLGEQVSRLRVGRLALGAGSRLRARVAGEATVPRVGLEEYRDNLGAMIGLARRSGAVPVLMTRPYVGVSDTPHYWREWGPDYNAATFEVARELEVDLIDFYTLFKHREELFADDSHFTAEGHALAAGWAWQELRSLLAVDPPE